MRFSTIYFSLLLLTFKGGFSQQNHTGQFSFSMYSDVKITIDLPAYIYDKGETIIIFFALPNGNSTEQTMGKIMKEGDDWHFDIQHIRAQTKFIRKLLPKKNIVTIYLENGFKSWPLWKQNHGDYLQRIQHITDTLYGLIPAGKKCIYLNGHSGGGSFIFGYLQGVQRIPAVIKRISFLDSDYGYDSTYGQKISDWLKETKDAHLAVFAYNDSVALYEGKPVVSATGGTWYRSHLMMRHLSEVISFKKIKDDSLIVYTALNKRVQFFFKTNPERKILHTQQVELNGFIHSVLCGTKFDSRGYLYFDKRAYSDLIE